MLRRQRRSLIYSFSSPIIFGTKRMFRTGVVLLILLWEQSFFVTMIVLLISMAVRIFRFEERQCPEYIKWRRQFDGLDETGIAYTQVDLPAIVEIPWTIEEIKETSAQVSKVLKAIQARAEERGLTAYRIAKDTGVSLGSVKKLLTTDKTDVRLSHS